MWRMANLFATFVANEKVLLDIAGLESTVTNNSYNPERKMQDASSERNICCFSTVFLNRCAVSSFQVCRQILFPYFAYSFLWKKSSFCQVCDFLGISVPPNFFGTLVCRELKKVENHCFSILC